VKRCGSSSLNLIIFSSVPIELVSSLKKSAISGEPYSLAAFKLSGLLKLLGSTSFIILVASAVKYSLDNLVSLVICGEVYEN
jgi:hypothetical protein